MAYFPNGSSGDVLHEQCEQCPLGPVDAETPCPVLFIQLVYNYDQLNKGQEKLKAAMQILIDDKTGECQVFKGLCEAGKVDGRNRQVTDMPQWLEESV